MTAWRDMPVVPGPGNRAVAGGPMYGVGAGGIPIHPSAGPVSHDM